MHNFSNWSSGALFFTFCLYFFSGFTQNLGDTTEVKSVRNPSISAIPIVYYTPETRWAFGAGAISSFRWKNATKDERPSQIQLAAAYTQENQILLYLPFRLFWKKGLYTSYGELGYYRYNYFFYGIGNKQQDDFEENYSVSYPRIRLNFLRLVAPNIYLGFRYWMDDYRVDVDNFDPEGQLITGLPPGSTGSRISAPGAVFLYDSRNSVFFPETGIYAEGVLQVNHTITGGDHNFFRLRLDASRYFKNAWNHVLAIQGFLDATWGNTPFNEMALLGGTRRLRGYYEGRFRDKKGLVFQTEYRMPLFWRIGVVGFFSYGGVADEFEAFRLDQFKYTWGGGLRFALDKREKLNLRIDAGFGKKSQGYYFTIGEAF